VTGGLSKTGKGLETIGHQIEDEENDREAIRDLLHKIWVNEGKRIESGETLREKKGGTKQNNGGGGAKNLKIRKGKEESLSLSEVPPKNNTVSKG